MPPSTPDHLPSLSFAAGAGNVLIDLDRLVATRLLLRTGTVQTTHPQPGRVAPPVPPPPEAIRALLGQLRNLPAQVPSELDDLEQARDRIVELERMLRERPVEVRTHTVVERVEVPAVDATTLERLEGLVTALKGTSAELLGVAEQLVAGLESIPKAPVRVQASPESASATHDEAVIGRHRSPVRRSAMLQTAAGGEGVSAPQQRILDALAAFEAVGLDQVAKSNVATWAGQSSTSSGFANNLGTLRSRGLIAYPPGVGWRSRMLAEAWRLLANPSPRWTSCTRPGLPACRPRRAACCGC